MLFERDIGEQECISHLCKKQIMKVQWPKLFWRTVFWLCAEMALTFLGLDDLADYSEFVFQNRSGFPVPSASIVLATLV